MNIEELKKLVNNCNTIKELLEKLNINQNSYNYKKIQNKLDDLKIDYSHLKRKSKVLGTVKEENTKYTYSSSALRIKLIKEGIKENKCEICGQLPEHMGKPLTLQLHHINGNHNDNRLENLIILCPNCHSQTENYSSHKNIKEKIKHYCEKCGKEISRKAKLCNKCKGEENRKVSRPSKEELLSKLNELKGNFTETGKYYGVSDNAIRKWCKNYEIPHLKNEIKKLL